MDTPSTALSLQQNQEKDEPSAAFHDKREATLPPEQSLSRGPKAKAPMIIRPTPAQKACVERIAEQVGMKRSHLDATFYLTGALLLGVERLNTSEPIGTWTRKEVAASLKQTFTSLFELLYEQDELPLAFALLIGRGSPASQRDQQHLIPAAMSHERRQEPHLPATPAEPGLPPFLPADAGVSLDGFPEDI